MPNKDMLVAVERYLAAQSRCDLGNDGSSTRAPHEKVLRDAHAQLQRENNAPDHQPIHRIVAAVDHLHHPALDAALKLALPLHAQIAIVYVVEPIPTPDIAVVVDATYLEDSGRTEAAALMSAIERELPAKALAFTLVRNGKAASEILSTAKDFNADLIIIGTHHRGSISRFFLGSVSDAVLRRSHCPVMFVADTAPSDAAPSGAAATPALQPA